MNVLRWSGRLILAGWLFGVLAGCSHPPAEAQVRAAIDQAADAAGSADAGALGEVLSDRFDGNHGALDRRDLVGLLRFQRLRGRSVKVLLGPVSVERRGERFVARFSVTLGGGRGWLPRRVGAYRVRSGWRIEDGQWRCYTATWKRVLR